jgi:hypothetical protein
MQCNYRRCRLKNREEIIEWVAALDTKGKLGKWTHLALM